MCSNILETVRLMLWMDYTLLHIYLFSALNVVTVWSLALLLAHIARIANITQPFPEIQRWQLRAISGEELVVAVYYPRKWTYGQSHISKACWPSIYFLERHSIHCSSASLAKLRHSIQVGKQRVLECCHLSLTLFTSLFLQSTLTCLPPSLLTFSLSLFSVLLLPSLPLLWSLVSCRVWLYRADCLADCLAGSLIRVGVMMTPVLCMALVEFTVKAHYQWITIGP